MKHFVVFVFLLCFCYFINAQESATNAGVFDKTELTVHNVAVHNGNFFFQGSVDSYGELPDKKEVNANTGTWCFNVNVKYATTGGGQSIISKTEAIGSYAGLNIFEDSGRMALQIKNYTNSLTLTLKADYVAGTGYHFVCVTYENAGTVKLYIDGRLRKEGKAPYFSFTKNPVRLGCSLDTFWKPFGGELTDVEIFQEVISEEQISCLYNARQTLKKELVIYPNPAQNAFRLELPEMEEDINVILTDALGKQVYKENRKKTKVIDISNLSLASGVYHVHLIGSKIYETQDLIIIPQ